MDNEMEAFDKWWMDWHWKNCKENKPPGFTLGQAVVAAWNAGKSYAQAGRVDAIAEDAAHTEVGGNVQQEKPR